MSVRLFEKFKAGLEAELYAYHPVYSHKQYDSLLAVLRRCVKAMEDINRDFAMAFIASGGHKETNEALAAAREYLEEAKP